FARSTPVLARFGGAEHSAAGRRGGRDGPAHLDLLRSPALRQAAGRTVVEAGAPGAQSAFLLAAIIALVAVVLAFLIKKPEDQEDNPAEEVNPVETAPRD